jgi:hypothetical protein
VRDALTWRYFAGVQALAAGQLLFAPTAAARWSWRSTPNGRSGHGYPQLVEALVGCYPAAAATSGAATS